MKLFWKTRWFFFKEQLKVILLFYCNFRFALLDIALSFSYFLQNPFTACRSYTKKLGESNVHIYGETPLATWAQIAKKANISSGDVLCDLGCGRGRLCFWTKLWIGCQVIGIDRVPVFVKKARRLTRLFGLSDISFCEGRLSDAPMELATVVYLYTFHFEESILDYFRLAPGTTLISISEPIHSKGLVLTSSFAAVFPWGVTEVFIHKKLPAIDS